MDLIDDPLPGENAHEYTVSEISGAVKRVIEGEFGRVRVRGEVGRVFAARSGHLYFDIKDDRCVLASVAWKGQVAALTARPEEGMEVVATGTLTTFGSQSKYQLTVDDLRPAGVGALMAMLERRRAALQAEGLFDAGRKRALPYLPEVIGVVTSPSGAVIRDILHRLADRFPRSVLVWPVAVQGPHCAAQVAAAIRGLNALAPGGAIPRPDLLIVARGGGSIEDLWGFNEEIVVRAAAESAIPLISAVGHETDTTLIDHAADHRAPTPTAAAERAVPVRADLMARVAEQGARLTRAATQATGRPRQRLADLSRALPRPDTLLAPARQRLDRADAGLPRALRNVTLAGRARLTEAAASLRPALLRRHLDADCTRLVRVAVALVAGLPRAAARRRDRLSLVAARVSARPIAREIARRAERLGTVAARLGQARDRALAAARTRLDTADRLHETLGYAATLRRGYVVVRGAGRRPITGHAAAAAEAGLELEFHDGILPVITTATTRRPRKSAAPAPAQGSLL